MTVEIHPFKSEDDDSGDKALERHRATAQTMYAMYAAYLEAGFAPEQAWELILYALDISKVQGAFSRLRG